MSVCSPTQGIHWPGSELGADNSAAVGDALGLQRTDEVELHARREMLQDILARGPHPDANPGEEIKIRGIYQFATCYCADPRIAEICLHWQTQMLDLCGRMRNHWTRSEKLSLVSLLTRFEETLHHLLHPPVEAVSLYTPVAREEAAVAHQAALAAHAQAVELFVRRAAFTPARKCHY